MTSEQAVAQAHTKALERIKYMNREIAEQDRILVILQAAGLVTKDQLDHARALAQEGAACE